MATVSVPIEAMCASMDQVKYPVKPKEEFGGHSPDSVLATYGFMPADVVMQTPSPAAPAFWPEVALLKPIKVAWAMQQEASISAACPLMQWLDSMGCIT